VGTRLAALQLDLFEQPDRKGFFSILLKKVHLPGTHPKDG
jgi:hypothetical protein